MADFEANHEQVKKLIKQAYKVNEKSVKEGKSRVSVMVWGQAGIGKTETIIEAAQELAEETKERLEVKTLILSNRDSTDINGALYPDKTTGKCRWFIPETYPETGRGILFLDELSNAEVMVQKAAQNFLLTGKIEGYTLPAEWLVVAAGNRFEDRAAVFEMPFPLKNRLLHITLSPASSEKQIEWENTHGIDHRIILYHNYKQTNINKPDYDGDPAQPTPRSWEFASRMISGVEDYKEIRDYVGSAVGFGIAQEFTAFLKVRERLDIDEILKNPEKAAELADEKDANQLLYALIGGLLEKYLDKPEQKLFNQILFVAGKMPAEYAMVLLILMLNRKQKEFITHIEQAGKMKLKTGLKKEFFELGLFNK